MSPRNRPEQRSASGIHLVSWCTIVVVALFATACERSPRPYPPERIRILALDPVDPLPVNSDILAVTTRESGMNLSVFVDMLDFQITDAPALQILLDTFPGSSEILRENFTGMDDWEISVFVYPDRQPQLEGILPGDIANQIGVTYDAPMDRIQIDLPQSLLGLPGPFSIAIASFVDQGRTLADTIEPIQSDDPSPEPVPLVLTFNNAFPAATPAQAFRSWDGAHNGPAGERFGLRHLLEAVESHRFPITLADMNKSNSLTGLQVLGADPWIESLEQDGLLFIPDTLPYTLCEQASKLGWPDEVLRMLREPDLTIKSTTTNVLSCADVPASGSGIDPPPGYHVLVRGDEGTHPSISSRRANQLLVIPESPAAHTPGVNGGPSLEFRRQLAKDLGTPQQGEPILLGIDFTHSFWGDPRTVSATLGWIAARPWIRPITVDTFLNRYLREQEWTVDNAPPFMEVSSDVNSTGIPLQKVLPFIDQDSSMGLRSLAWQLLLQSHTSAVCFDALPNISTQGADQARCGGKQAELSTAYTQLRLIKIWEDSRQSMIGATHSVETILDQNREPTLWATMTKQWLAIQESREGALLAIIGYDPVVGAIPIIWNPEGVSTSDMNGIEFVQVQISESMLKLDFIPEPSFTHLILPVYLPGEQLKRNRPCVKEDMKSMTLTLSCPGETRWQIDFLEADWDFQSFHDTPARWDRVEDPDQDMPAGHYLPFPYGRLSLRSDQRFSLIFSALPDEVE